MASPFPGMDPYLEQARFWPEFYSRLIVAIADALAPSLLPRYYIAVETRTYRDSADEELLVGIPDANEEVRVDLQPLVNGIYERSGYRLRIDYQAPLPPPAPAAADQAWLEERLHSR